MSAPARAFLLTDLATAVLARHDLPGWTLRTRSPWCHVGPATPTERVQGWKLHVSATALSAPLVLAVASEVLLANRCAFKFAHDLDAVEELTSIRYDRAQAGKFVTVYPRDDDQLHLVAEQLCAATAAVPGPRILTDRPYRPGSVVQYRYGAFLGVPTVTDDGGLEVRLRDPDGQLVTDARVPWFAPPAWATPLDVPGPVPPVDAERSPAGNPVLAGRFEVLAAIRHSARGGVFRGRDVTTGDIVVLKQARAHIGGRRDGLDARDQLVHEAEVLAALAPLTPHVIDVFVADGDTFLVEEYVAGQSLADHVAGTSDNDPDGSVDETTRLAVALVDLVREVHRRGWVLRDLSTTNVMVGIDGRLVLIDPEYAAHPDEVVQRAVTPGYAAPEVLTGPIYGPAPGDAIDRYAVGAALVHLLLGAPPMLPADQGPGGRTTHERIAVQLDTAAAERPLVRQWRRLILGLTQDDPRQRWSLDVARAYLGSAPHHPHGIGPAADPPDPDRVLDRVLDDGLAHLVDSHEPTGPWRWPADAFGSGTDPLNVQYGAAGVLAVLVRAARDRPGAGTHDLARTTAHWIADRIADTPRLLPGLHFGRSGTAWALREAADLLDDDVLRAASDRLALGIEVRAANPDVCHGVAGAGFARLALWRATGRPEYLADVRACADLLADTARHRDDGVFWPVPDHADSRLAGAWHFGYAHGVAGVGDFLLAASGVTGSGRHRELAVAAGDTLARAAEHDDRTGAAVWRTDRDRPGTDREMRLHWCSGASGIGTFLVRLAAVAPDPARDALVPAAATAVHRSRWSVGTAACHGLAGDAQFLLDAADRAAGTEDAARYRRQATDLADVLVSRAALRDGRLLLPDESGLRVFAGYGTGSAGALDLLLRLRHGGGRTWSADHTPVVTTRPLTPAALARPVPPLIDLGRR